MGELTKQVKKWLREHGVSGGGIVAGVSGGADSVCLLAVLAELSAECGLSVTAVHVNHGIRGGEAAEDERFVRELCGRMGIFCAVRRLDVPALAGASHQTIEEAGRAARYEVLEQVRRERGADWIAVAHHREDQAETVLLHLFRGSGLRGAGGIRPVQGRVIRPLLDASRPEIEAFLRGRGFSWREDSTNREPDAARNFIRLEIMPALRSRWPEVTGALCRGAEHFAAADDYLRQEAARFVREEKHVEREGFSLSVAALLGLHPALRDEVLRTALAQAAGAERDLTARHVGMLVRLCEGQSGRRADFPYGLTVWRCYDRLMFGGGAGEEAPPVLPESEMRIVGAREAEKIAENDCTKCFAYDKMNRLPVWRYRQPGDRIALYADGRGKKLQDFFTDRKIPAGQRGRTPLLALGEEILWVPGLRVSEKFRVTEQTSRVLIVTISGRNEITFG